MKSESTELLLRWFDLIRDQFGQDTPIGDEPLSTAIEVAGVGWRVTISFRDAYEGSGETLTAALTEAVGALALAYRRDSQAAATPAMRQYLAHVARELEQFTAQPITL